MSQNNIDNIVLKNFSGPGFFIEAGGSDPFDQNNTLLLERNGWKGLIVEPSTRYNQSYSQYRQSTIVENVALVSFDHEDEFIEGDFSHYMMGGVINYSPDIPDSSWNPIPHPCSTLDAILKKNSIFEVDFFSLDVEGYEMEVLKGISFEDVFFHLIVVELHINPNSRFPIPMDFESFLSKKQMRLMGLSGHHQFYVNEKSNLINTFRI